MKIYFEDGKYVKVNIQKNHKGTYEYDINGILIGVYDPDVMKDSKFLETDLEKNNTIENELSAESKDEIKQIVNQIKEKIEQVDRKDIEKEARQNELINKYMEEAGMDKERVRSITIVDLEKDKKEEKQEKQEKQENKEKDETTIANNTKTNKNVKTTKDVNVKQEIDLEERANDVQDVKRWLGSKLPDNIKKIGVIESYELSSMKDENGKVIDNSSTRYGLVTIGKNGEVEPLKKYIPQLEQNHASGNNPIQSKYQINTDGTVEKDPVLSEYRIGNKIIQLDKDSGDDLEINIGKYSPFGNELVTTRVRDTNTPFATDIETRKAAMGYYEGVYESRNSYEEAKEHEEAGCDVNELTEKEIDGNKDTGHKHFTKEEFEKCVTELMEDEDISNVFTEREIRERLVKKIEKNSLNDSNDLDENDDFDENIKKAKVESIEEIKEQTQAELEEDAAHFKTREQ